MPNLDEHCKHCLARYGVEGRDIHQWLDEPSKEYASSHRQFRHDTESVKLVGELFSKNYGRSLAESIALDHIMADHEEEIKNRNIQIVVNLPEQKEMPSIHCLYCKTLLKPSDQVCPKCGSSRAKITYELDRNIEMEKLKLQEKKKQLRKELKLELKYSSQTPYERLYWYWWYRWLTGINKGSVGKEDLAVLDKLVSEDLKKDPNLENRWFDSLSEQQRSLLHIKKIEKT
jgi:uncharacterized Zn finger protein (UPF0148 family)